jgi:hypothetical protein
MRENPTGAITITVNYNVRLDKTIICPLTAGPAGVASLSPVQGVAFVTDITGEETAVETHLAWTVLADAGTRVTPLVEALYGKRVAELVTTKSSGVAVDTTAARAHRREVNRLVHHADAMRRDGTCVALWAAEAAVLAKHIDPRVPLDALRSEWLGLAATTVTSDVERRIVEDLLGLYDALSATRRDAVRTRWITALLTEHGPAIAMWCATTQPLPAFADDPGSYARACGALAVRIERMGFGGRAKAAWAATARAWDRAEHTGRERAATANADHVVDRRVTASIAELASAAFGGMGRSYGPRSRDAQPAATVPDDDVTGFIVHRLGAVLNRPRHQVARREAARSGRRRPAGRPKEGVVHGRVMEVPFR